MDTPSHEEDFGELRSLLQKQPDIKVFADVCEVITRMDANEPGVFADRYVDYASEQLASWPATTKTIRCHFEDIDTIKDTPWAPLITSVMVIASKSPEFTEWRERLAVFPNLTHLGLFEFGMKRKEMFEALDSGFLDGLTGVTFHDVNLNNIPTFTGFIERLSEREGCAGLRELALQYAQLKAKHIEILCASSLPSRLRTLDLSKNTSFKAAGVKSLVAAAERFEELDRLLLANCGLTSTATKALAGAKWPKPLSHLALGENQLKHNALKPLDKAGMLPALVDRQGAPSLNISSFDLDEAGLRLLVDRGLFEGLHHFQFSGSESAVETLAPLIESDTALTGCEHLLIRLFGTDDAEIESLLERMQVVELASLFSDEELVLRAIAKQPKLERMNIRCATAGFFGEPMLAAMLDRLDVDTCGLYVLVPTDSDLLERARVVDRWEVKPRDEQIGVSMRGAVRNRSVRPLSDKGNYRY